MKELNWRVLFVVGIAAGIVQALTGVAMYVAGVYFDAWSMIVTSLVLVLCIILGTRWYGNNVLGGTMTYGQALIVGFVISVSTGVVYALYNFISISFIYSDFLDEMIREGVAQIQASGLSSEQTSERIASLKRNATLPRIALGNLIRLSIVGAIYSTITSILLRSKSPSKIATAKTAR